MLTVMVLDGATEFFVRHEVHQLQKNGSPNILANALWKWGVQKENIIPKVHRIQNRSEGKTRLTLTCQRTYSKNKIR
jgi:hypothetical protein